MKPNELFGFIRDNPPATLPEIESMAGELFLIAVAFTFFAKGDWLSTRRFSTRAAHPLSIAIGRWDYIQGTRNRPPA